MPNILKNQYALILGGITLFVLILSALFPLIADDFVILSNYSTHGGVAAAVLTYTEWTARTGEILSALLGTHLTGLPFTIINALMFAIILVTIHFLVFVRKGETGSDSLFLITFFTLLSISTVFGAVFLWRIGAIIYAWSLAFCLMHFTVYRYHYAGIDSWYKSTNLLVVVLFCLLSFLAGMSSFDLGALGCLIHIAIFIYRRANKYSDNPRFLLPAICFIAGFIALYTALGMKVRASYFGDEYTSLGQILSWLLAFEFHKLATHYIYVIAGSVHKTNGLLALASMAATYFIIKLQTQYHFMPFKRWQILLGYLGTVIVLLALFYTSSGKLYGDYLETLIHHCIAIGKLSKPFGDFLGTIIPYVNFLLSAGTVILFANFLLSAIALVYLFKIRSAGQHLTATTVVFLHCLMIVDVSLFTVGIGITTAPRAYLTASVLASLILALLIQSNWKVLIQKYIFIPLFFVSTSFLLIETYGLHITNKALIIKPLSTLSANDDLVIYERYEILKSPQFYNWGWLSTDKNNWANHYFSKYHNIKSVSQIHKMEKVSLIEYIKYLSKITDNQ